MNTKQPQSEGVRRIVIVCSVVLSVLWVMCAVGMIGKINLRGNELGYFVMCIVISGIVLFFTPGVIPKLIYWISDGFSIDRIVTTNTNRPRSEGVRRIVLTFSVALPLAWAIWTLPSITKQVSFLIEEQRSGELDFAFIFAFIVVAFILAIFVMVLFFIPRWVSQFIYWIKDGFSLDKKR